MFKHFRQIAIELYKSVRFRIPRLVIDYFKDIYLQIRYQKSGARIFCLLEANTAKILEDIHSVEKYLILPETIEIRAKDKINRLDKLIKARYDLISNRDELIQYANECIKDWKGKINTIQQSNNISKRTETKSVIHYKDRQNLNKSFVDVLEQRKSVRTYQDKIVNSALIEKLTKLSQTAPSQCNRQSVRLHYYSEKQTIMDILNIQGGAKTFDSQVRNLFIISNTISAWDSSEERHQAYVDGGIFLMNLLLVIQNEGLVSCPLNLAMRPKELQTLRKCAKIPDSEIPIVAISFGWAAENSLVCRSNRLKISEILTIH
ncbi:nitroreductase family protein [Amylibacter sp.]|nr:nitroreductase family protein [Amylibacter sp.]